MHLNSVRVHENNTHSLPPALRPKVATTIENADNMIKKQKDAKHSLETCTFIRLVTSGSPFITSILVEVLPIGAKVPHISTYYGSVDLEDHLLHFQNTMIFHNFIDATLCKTFTKTLKGATQTWFNQFLSSSISSFEELTELFKAHFFHSRLLEKDSSYLYPIKQWSN